MNDLMIIQNKIYEIRGQKVMLDFDLAELFSTETRLLKRAVRRNIERFPPDFMFELSKEEANYLLSSRVSQNGTPMYNFSAYAPFAFTSLSDQNDINEDTRAQLDAISMALAELQAKEPAKKERKPIGFK